MFNHSYWHTANTTGGDIARGSSSSQRIKESYGHTAILTYYLLYALALLWHGCGGQPTRRHATDDTYIHTA